MNPHMSREGHATTFMHELNNGEGAEIDNRIVPMVKFLNKLGATTFESCQGGAPRTTGYVCFTVGDTAKHDDIVKFTFGLLHEMLSPVGEDMNVDGVSLSVNQSRIKGFYGVMDFCTPYIDEITKRLGCYCEMNHK